MGIWDGDGDDTSSGSRHGPRRDERSRSDPRRPGMNTPPSRMGAGRSGSGPGDSQRANSPYRPYGQGTSSRMPVPRGSKGTLGGFGRDLVPRMPTDDDVRGMTTYTTTYGTTHAPIAEPPAEKHRLGVAIFHDGNPGHLWRGEVASAAGEAMLGAGVLMWLASLTQSPEVIALALLALGLPFLLFGPLAAPLENIAEPGSPLKWLGRLRILLALGLLPMHFRTILPVVFALLFAISFFGRLQDALRIAAMRACLAPNEPEHVANDVQVGRAIAAILGPLAATLFFVLIGERILLVSIVVAVLFLISSNSETFLDALPPEKRAFLLVTPETAYPVGEAPDTALEDEAAQDADDDDGVLEDADARQARRERGLPAWYQQGPKHPGQAIADLRAGIMLAGGSAGSAVALWGLCLLALLGSGLAVLEVFFIVDSVGLPSFYLGPLLAAIAAGLALGSSLAGNPGGGRGWRVYFLGGIVGSGILLILLPVLPMMAPVLLLGMALGVTNAVAVLGARSALRNGFTGLEQRAISAVETWLTALFSLVGILLFGFCAAGDRFVSVPLALPAWQADEVFYLAGISLVVAAVVFGALLFVLGKENAPRAKKAASVMDDSGMLPALDDESVELAAANGDWGGWDGEDGSGEWGESSVYDSRYASSYASSYGYAATGYEEAAPPDDTDDSDDNDYYEDEEDDDTRGQRAPRRPPERRPRW